MKYLCKRIQQPDKPTHGEAFFYTSSESDTSRCIYTHMHFFPPSYLPSYVNILADTVLDNNVYFDSERQDTDTVNL